MTITLEPEALLIEDLEAYTPIQDADHYFAPETAPVLIIGPGPTLEVKVSTVNPWTGPRRSSRPRSASSHQAPDAVIPKARQFRLSVLERALTTVTATLLAATSVFAVWAVDYVGLFA